MDENTGFITTASNFKGKKGERFAIQVSARDNHGRIPTNEAQEEATAQVTYHDDYSLGQILIHSYARDRNIYAPTTTPKQCNENV